MRAGGRTLAWLLARGRDTLRPTKSAGGHRANGPALAREEQPPTREQSNPATRRHAVLNERIRRGETVTVRQVIEADDSDRTRGDLDRLAEDMTTRTGQPHYVYVNRLGSLVVYAEAYEQGLGLVRS